VKGRGSAIFLHQWRRPHYPTDGCIGVSRTDLRRIAKGLRFGTKLVIA
jgi:L,D-peptidoglycan transpeptidase YkuD (ErfK/YbiS/YcfS/YnhG family)